MYFVINNSLLIYRFDQNLEARGVFLWKADNSNSVRRMSNFNENVLAAIEAKNTEKVAKFTAMKDFDESKIMKED